jgi:hypothetical protein
MKFDRRASWPHPVIAPDRDDIVLSDGFDFDLNALPAGNDWVLSFKAKYTDPTLAASVAAGDSAHLLYAECAETHFREVFSTQKTEDRFAVPAGLLRGDVEVRMLVVATRDIARYSHPLQHGDYKGVTFSVAVGEPLAITAPRVLPLQLDADPVLQLSSIFDIKAEADLVRSMKVELFDQRIILRLPEDDYERYSAMYAAPKLKDLLSSTVLFPALLEALHFMQKEDEDSLEDFRVDHRWCRTLLRSLDKLKINIFESNEPDICFVAAQELLRGPLRRSLDNLNSIYDLR